MAFGKRAAATSRGGRPRGAPTAKSNGCHNHQPSGRSYDIAPAPLGMGSLTPQRGVPAARAPLLPASRCELATNGPAFTPNAQAFRHYATDHLSARAHRPYRRLRDPRWGGAEAVIL